MATILYARVSTAEQTVEHQLSQAKASGFSIDEVVTDSGLSGVSYALADRPGGKRLWDLLRRGDTLVVRWVDRLGRNYRDVSDNIRLFMRKGVIVRTVINGLTFDGATQDPMQQAVRDALIGFMAATAEAQATALREAQKAGIEHAKANSRALSYRGRKPSFTATQFEQVSSLLANGMGVAEVSRTVGLSRQTVTRIKSDPVRAAALLKTWDLLSQPSEVRHRDETLSRVQAAFREGMRRNRAR